MFRRSLIQSPNDYVVAVANIGAYYKFFLKLNNNKKNYIIN